MNSIEKTSPETAESICRKITADLPEYFGLTECNEQYALGVRTRENFAAKVNENFVGLISLDFPYQKNSSIYWMGVLRKFQNKGIGRMLLERASTYAKQRGAVTMTVETLSSEESDENYLKTYKFYEAQGFEPLFNLKPQGYEWNMVYMAKNLSQNPNRNNPLTEVTIRAFNESDISTMVKGFAAANWLKPRSLFEKYLEEQQLGERLIWVAYIREQLAGYITLKWESKYEPYKQAKIPEIMDLNVLPHWRERGVGSELLSVAEQKASKKSAVIGIGVGLYDGYGAAQKLYIKRGYIPNGGAITYHYESLKYGAKAILDDDLVLWFTKRLQKF